VSEPDLHIESDERRLIARLLAGDPQAFDACFAVYFPKLYRFALRRVGGDVAAAEDIAQATLCRALESLPTFRGEASLFTWLCTLCRREMFLRGGGRSVAASSAVVVSEDDPHVRAALESLAAPDADPASAATVQQLRDAVLVALDYLAPEHARVLELKYIQELPVVAIAERLGRSPKATESLLTRARTAFRESFSLLSEELRT
jgi:RNA polymerase sigma-70 factor (ECF subfamily)